MSAHSPGGPAGPPGARRRRWTSTHTRFERAGPGRVGPGRSRPGRVGPGGAGRLAGCSAGGVRGGVELLTTHLYSAPDAARAPRPGPPPPAPSRGYPPQAPFASSAGTAPPATPPPPPPQPSSTAVHHPAAFKCAHAAERYRRRSLHSGPPERGAHVRQCAQESAGEGAVWRWVTNWGRRGGGGVARRKTVGGPTLFFRGRFAIGACGLRKGEENVGNLRTRTTPSRRLVSVRNGGRSAGLPGAGRGLALCPPDARRRGWIPARAAALPRTNSDLHWTAIAKKDSRPSGGGGGSRTAVEGLRRAPDPSPSLAGAARRRYGSPGSPEDSDAGRLAGAGRWRPWPESEPAGVSERARSSKLCSQKDTRLSHTCPCKAHLLVASSVIIIAVLQGRTTRQTS